MLQKRSCFGFAKLAAEPSFSGSLSELVYVLDLSCLSSCSWRYKCEYVSMSRICDVTCALDHVVRFTKPSHSVLAYCKRKSWSQGRPGNEASKLTITCNILARHSCTGSSCYLLSHVCSFIKFRQHSINHCRPSPTKAKHLK